MTKETTVTLKGWVLRDEGGKWLRLTGKWEDAPRIFKFRKHAVEYLSDATPVRVEVTIREVGK
jgi:hypothetical protein